MKTAVKILLAISAFFVIIGITITAVALSSGAIIWNKISTNKYETVENTFDAEDISSLKVTCDEADVSVVKADDDKITVYTSELEKLTYNVTFNDGVLKITVNNTMRWFDHITINFSNGSKVKIALPEEIFDNLGKVNITTKSGEITLEKFKAKSLDASSLSGDIILKNLTVEGSADIGTSSGEILFNNTEIKGNLKAETSSGEIVVRNAKFEKDFYTESISGDISAYSSDFTGEVELYTTSGEILLDNSEIKDDLVARTSSGDIDFRGLKAENITAKTSSGEINGTLYNGEDYLVTAKTSSGNIDIPDSSLGSTKKITLTTSSGDIELSFIG